MRPHFFRSGAGHGHGLRVLAILLVAVLSPGTVWSDAPARESFAALDAKVRALGKPESPAQLATRLAGITNTDWERVRAIYVWLAENIAYDVEGFFGRRTMVADAATAFNTGRSVCQGYAELFSLVAARLGIECTVASGYAKGYGYRPGQAIGTTNHAWNLARIEGHWYLFDATWGAGALTSGKFVKRFSEAWFATDPRLFVLHHLPENPRDELLPAVVTPEAYQKLPYVEAWLLDRMAAGRLDADQQLQLLKKPDVAFIQGIDDLAATGFAPDEIVALSGIKNPGPHFAYRVQSLVKLGAKPSELLILAQNGTLPEAYDIPALGLTRCQVPLTLAKGQTAHFELAGTGIAAVALITGGKWQYFTAAEGVFTLDCLPAAGKASLAVKIAGGGSSYATLIDYQVK